MVQTRAKRRKVELETAEEVLFNSDTLSKIITYLPSVDLLNLALTYTKFGVSNNDDDSIIEESACIAVQEIGTEEQLAALPRHNGESSLADYHYLQLMREPLLFDQLVGEIEYVNEEDKSCVRVQSGNVSGWRTAFSNYVLRAGKHYATFEVSSSSQRDICVLVGLMRPGKTNYSALESVALAIGSVSVTIVGIGRGWKLCRLKRNQ